jgi:hypothetical protein
MIKCTPLLTNTQVEIGFGGSIFVVSYHNCKNVRIMVANALHGHQILLSSMRLKAALVSVQSPYVEAPQFGGYCSFDFPMPIAPPGAQRDPIP